MATLDRGQLATERSYADVQRRLKRNYRQAVHEVQQKMDDFNKRYKTADVEKRKQLSEGKITKSDYDSWKRGQVYQGKLWQQKRDSLTETLYQADVLSTKIVNGERLNVFTANANHICYNLEHTAGLDFGFSVYDNATVSKILKDEPTLLPPRIVKHSEDVDWYHKIINNCVTQGIIQGESIPEIAKRIAETTGERGEHAAIRNARTAMTAAQNAGRIEAMHAAQELGIKLQKRWLATLDNRTRDSHQHLDGQVQNVDDPFESDYGYIMFPGDPWAEPADVYNCRCTLLYEHPEYPSDIPRRDNINGEIIGDMTYDEWEAAKERIANDTGVNTNKRHDIAREIKYGGLFPSEAKQITKDTLDDLNKQYPLSRELDYVGDVRTHRGLDTETDILDLHYEYPDLTPCGAQYLKYGADGKSGPCIEVHNNTYSTQKLQDEFEERYALRLKYGDPMLPPKPGAEFYTVSDTLEGTVRHEYGHALSDDKGVFAGSHDNKFRQWQNDYWIKHKDELPAISKYAASHPDEMFAEAFVQAQDTRHPDTLAYKLSKEIMDAFDKYNRGEPF